MFLYMVILRLFHVTNFKFLRYGKSLHNVLESVCYEAILPYLKETFIE